MRGESSASALRRRSVQISSAVNSATPDSAGSALRHSDLEGGRGSRARTNAPVAPPFFMPSSTEAPPTFPPQESSRRPNEAQSKVPAPRKQNTETKTKGSVKEWVLILSGQDYVVRPELTALKILDSGFCPSVFLTAPCTIRT